MNWQKILGSVCGAGFLPVAPGTWGAAAGLLLLLPFFGKNGVEFAPYLGAATLFFTFLGAKAAHDLAPEWGEDPKQFVLDEVIGLWMAMLFHPIDWPHLAAAFVLFRVFDIWKPLGIRRLEAVPNGWGVQLDDLAAGAVANLFLWFF
jgi:phosphatidylglycerophosphatase A